MKIISMKNSYLCALVAVFAISGCTNQQNFVQTYPVPETIPESIRQELDSVMLEVPEDKPVVLGFGGGYGVQGDEVGKGVGEALNGLGREMSSDPAGILLLPLLIPIAAVGGAIEGSFDKVKHRKNKETIDALSDSLGNEITRYLGERLNDLSEKWERLTGENAIDSQNRLTTSGGGSDGLAIQVTELVFQVNADSDVAKVGISTNVTLSNSQGEFPPEEIKMQADVPRVPLRKIEEDDAGSLIPLLEDTLDRAAASLFNKIFVATDIALPLNAIPESGYQEFHPEGISKLTPKRPTFRWQLDESSESFPQPDYFLFFNETPERGFHSTLYSLTVPPWSQGVRVEGYEYQMAAEVPCNKVQRWTVQPVFVTQWGTRLGVPMKPVYYKSSCKQ